MLKAPISMVGANASGGVGSDYTRDGCIPDGPAEIVGLFVCA
jgi:hypothetical protein